MTPTFCHQGPEQCLFLLENSLFHCLGEDKENKSSPRAFLLNLRVGAVVTQSSKEHVIIYWLAET